jgi:hypothetical protein
MTISGNLTEEELDKLGDEEMLLSESAEAKGKTLFFSQDGLVAYPLADGEPMAFVLRK